MRHVLLSSVCLLAVLAVPAQAGQLFPPANIGTNPNAACPSGQLLGWDGSQVVCSNPTAGVTVSCPTGQVLTGIVNGQPVCVASAVSGTDTGGWTCTYFPAGFPNIGNNQGMRPEVAGVSCVNSLTGAAYVANYSSQMSLAAGTTVFDTHSSLYKAYQAALQAYQQASDATGLNQGMLNLFMPALEAVDPKLASLHVAYNNARAASDAGIRPTGIPSSGGPMSASQEAIYANNRKLIDAEGAALNAYLSERETARKAYLASYYAAVQKAKAAWQAAN